ncbi:MAG: hypothetical protein JJD97_10935 [Gemmatimonadaceae bacterium]|nr:hypothetical protein [Gemmatimonadaceae bacterium]
MQRIRVLLASPPGMLRDIIEKAVTAQSDMRLVGEIDVRDANANVISTVVAASLAPDVPDVVIVDRVDERSMRLLDGLLYDHPRLAVIAVTRDGRGAHLRVLRPHDEVIGDVSPMGLVAAIRESRRPEMT